LQHQRHLPNHNLFPYTTLFRSKRNSSGYDWTVDHILTYKNVINNIHRLDVTLVAGQRERKFEQTEATGSNYSNLRLSYNDLSLADRKSTRLNSSHVKISYAVFC